MASRDTFLNFEPPARAPPDSPAARPVAQPLAPARMGVAAMHFLHVPLVFVTVVCFTSPRLPLPHCLFLLAAAGCVVTACSTARIVTIKEPSALPDGNLQSLKILSALAAILFGIGATVVALSVGSELHTLLDPSTCVATVADGKDHLRLVAPALDAAAHEALSSCAPLGRPLGLFVVLHVLLATVSCYCHVQLARLAHALQSTLLTERSNLRTPVSVEHAAKKVALLRAAQMQAHAHAAGAA